MNQHSEIEHYIGQFPENVQILLQEIRTNLKNWVPEAIEKMSYGIPTFYLNGNLVHFAGYQHHIGFYPGASGIEQFKDKIKAYKNSKGAVQFPIQETLPFDLIKEITLFRVEENLNKKPKAKK